MKFPIKAKFISTHPKGNCIVMFTDNNTGTVISREENCSFEIGYNRDYWGFGRTYNKQTWKIIGRKGESETNLKLAKWE